MPRPQFTLRALLVLLLAAACFFAGIRFERWRFWRERWKPFVDAAMAADLPTPNYDGLPYPDERRWRGLTGNEDR